MNSPFVVASTYKCEDITEGLETVKPDPLWRTTALGCKLLLILQDMYKFQMTYENGYKLYNAAENGTAFSYSRPPDVYARPLPLTTTTRKYGFPLEAVINRRYGFVLRRLDDNRLPEFFRLPFAAKTWYYIIILTAIIAVVLSLLACWEKKVVNAQDREYSTSHELLVVVGAICQHIPPISPSTAPRRIAYFTFFLFTYLVYSFYTSNLLSHLVNDRNEPITLSDLVDSDYKVLLLENMQLNISRKLDWKRTVAILPQFKKMEKLRQKQAQLKIVNVYTGLKDVATKKAALLSDYTTIYPYMKSVLNNEAICDLVEIDVFRNLRENLFTSKNFPLKEEFKIGLLRIRETGILKQIKKMSIYAPPRCHVTPETHACFQLVIAPLITLAGSYVISSVILVLEKLHFERTRVWPYTE